VTKPKLIYLRVSFRNPPAATGEVCLSPLTIYLLYYSTKLDVDGGRRVSSTRSPPTGEISGVRSRAGAFAGCLREFFALASVAAGVAFTGVSANKESMSDIISPLF
jgi:hypothetical protein